MAVDLKDWLNSINSTKKNIIDEDPDTESKYLPYIINRCMSGHLDAIMYANEMNLYHKISSSYKISISNIDDPAEVLSEEEEQNLDEVKVLYKHSNGKRNSSPTLQRTTHIYTREIWTEMSGNETEQLDTR